MTMPRCSTHLHASLAFGMIAAAIAACYVGPGTSGTGTGTGTGTGQSATDPLGGGATNDAAAPSGPTTVAANGLPCDVDALLGKYCRSCHGSSSGKPLGSYADLTAASKSNPSKTMAAAAAERMRSTSSPMPPGKGMPAPSDAEISAFEKWVADNSPKGTCGEASQPDAGTGEPSTPPVKPTSVCTSNTFWSSGKKGPTMQPGKACISCHLAAEGESIVSVGGTVYPTVMEPDLCYGVPGGAQVIITDAANQTHTLDVGPTGNFLLYEGAPLAMPIRAKVVQNGKTREMFSAQNTGDCNACHTENGANGAPGRIMLP